MMTRINPVALALVLALAQSAAHARLEAGDAQRAHQPATTSDTAWLRHEAHAGAAAAARELRAFGGKFEHAAAWTRDEIAVGLHRVGHAFDRAQHRAADHEQPSPFDYGA